MFIYSAKLDKKKLTAILLAVAAVILIFVLILARGRETPSDDQHAAQLKLLRTSRLETNEERLALLAALGWEVAGQPAEETEVRIPSVFSDVYERYNRLQKEQGLDLEACKGEKAMRYTYQIVNHPSGETAVRATLLVRNNHLIGGDICSSRLDGFMHTLLKPDDASAARNPQTSASSTSQGTEPPVPDASITTSVAEFPTVGGDEAAFPTD